MRFVSENIVFKFLRQIMGRKHRIRFQSENAAFKILRHSVDWA